METTPAIQDYLGAIYDLAGSEKPVIGARLARHMHLSAPSITEALRRMQKDGYVRLDRKKEIRLTTKGLGMAETMARRHRLLERWLTDVLGLDWSRAHDEAHRLEHALSPVVEEKLAELLGMPSTCPARQSDPRHARPRGAPSDPAEPGQDGPGPRRGPHHRGGGSRPPAPALPLGDRRPSRQPAHRRRGRTLCRHHHRDARRPLRDDGPDGRSQDLGLRSGGRSGAPRPPGRPRAAAKAGR